MRSLLASLSSLFIMFGSTLCAQAAERAELDRLFAALDTIELFEIMHTEGLMQADELQSDMFPGRGGDGWTAIATRIYDVEAMSETFRGRFDRELADTDVTPLVAFFEGSAGREIISLELSARRALMDPEVEEASKDTFEQMVEDSDPRVDLLENFIDVNDLVELNVAGALNASLAFYQGLADGGSFNLGEDQMLREVWEQEPELRDDINAWMRGFLALSYQPLDDADLEAYIALSASAAGQDLNRALFAGFDDIFNEISYDLGAAASRFMVSEEL